MGEGGAEECFLFVSLCFRHVSLAEKVCVFVAGSRCNAELFQKYAESCLRNEGDQSTEVESGD